MKVCVCVVLQWDLAGPTFAFCFALLALLALLCFALLCLLCLGFVAPAAPAVPAVPALHRVPFWRGERCAEQTV